MGSVNDFTKIPNRGEQGDVNLLLCKNNITTFSTSAKRPPSSPPPKGKPTRNPRAVRKNGDYNLTSSGVPSTPFLRDTFTALVDCRWRWTIAVFAAGFFGSWTAFAAAWWLLAWAHGDLQPQHLPAQQAAARYTPCVTDIHGFASCLLFSVETQHTTGYGEKRPTERCPDALLLMCVQNIVGLVIEAFLVGVFFAKVTRPKMRKQTIRFSKEAVVCLQDGALCLAFRVGDERKKSSLIGTKVGVKLVRQQEGDLCRLAVGCEEDLLLMWPVLVVHVIDETSPLYRVSAEDLAGGGFEIVVSVEGTVESTDQKTQARSSYVAAEVLWGRRFGPVVSVDGEGGGYVVEYSKFDDTVPVDGVPTCSAAELDSKKHKQGG